MMGRRRAFQRCSRLCHSYPIRSGFCWQERLAPKLNGVRDRIVDLGVRDDIHLVYRACDALVHPTLEDTYGMVVHEAMSHGRPVVVSASSYCGIAADLTDGQTACILQNPDDSTELTQAIEKVLQPANYERLSENALKWAEQRRWPEMALQLEDIYQQSVQQRA